MCWTKWVLSAMALFLLESTFDNYKIDGEIEEKGTDQIKNNVER